MPAHAIADALSISKDWSPAGAALRSAKPRWVREMVWEPLVAPPTVGGGGGGGASRGTTPVPHAPTTEAPKAKKTGPNPSPWATSTPRAGILGSGRGNQTAEKDGPCVGQYHIAHDSVLPRAPATRICKKVGGSRLPPEGSQTARPASAPGHNHHEEELPERIVESIRGKSPCADFGRLVPRPDKMAKGESFWEVMEEKDITKLSTQKRSVGHQFGKAPRGPTKVAEGASWPPNVNYKHCSNEHKTGGTVAFDKQSERFADTQVPLGAAPKAGARYPAKGFWDRVQGQCRHERCASHDDDRAIQRRPKSVMDFSKTTGRPLLTPEPKDPPTGAQYTSKSESRSGRTSSFQEGVPHLPEDPAKPSPIW